MAKVRITEDGRNLMLNRMYLETPDSSAPAVFAIGTDTTEPTINDTALGTIIQGWSGSSDFKVFVSGYPILNTTKKEVTIRGFVSTTEANGSSIAETGNFNTDGTRVMDTRNTFTAVSKDSNKQIAFIWKHRII
ncbi:hypothetical protein LCGC14_1047410 [marine sediment metagenome]|uniref:Uncharacterized protein n=1 Tax=marine sediment metagenome TaxID=412755 RepID=A0A0F9Q823_9ZZZZ